ncbi:MAG TPA: DUF983 domain-containing protein [Gemmatimonadaceae bacterium]|nr:DUF983 domain-containing protein [Gemmatimonadaceae bacterium]
MSTFPSQSPFRMLGRALVLHCPRCGSGGIFVSWFKTRERCPRCSLPLQRGEEHDYWLGGMMFNIVLSELLAVLVVAIAILASWPDVPWNVVWFGAIALMLAAPVLLYPVSRTTWLAFDLVFRPGHESHYR